MMTAPGHHDDFSTVGFYNIQLFWYYVYVPQRYSI